MRAFTLNNAAFDLLANDIPIGSSVALSAANTLVIQGADDSAFTAPATLATGATATPWQSVNLTYRYIRVSTVAVASFLYD